MLKTSSPLLVALVFSVSLAACASNQSHVEPAPESAPAAAEADPPLDAAARPQLSAEDCAARGGTVIADIGDGAIHRPDYRCPNGAEPSGVIKSAGDGPVAVEGSVCCPG